MGVSAGLYMYNVVVKKFTFAISSRDEFLLHFTWPVHLSQFFLVTDWFEYFLGPVLLSFLQRKPIYPYDHANFSLS